MKKVTSPKLLKKHKKEAKSSRTGPATPDSVTTAFTAKILEAKYPKRIVKIAKKDESLLKATMKNMDAKKAKNKSKTSKRTTPGKVNERTTPDNARREGQHWIKSSQKQTNDNNLRAQKKATKKR
jgi:hypothetical protein